MDFFSNQLISYNIPTNSSSSYTNNLYNPTGNASWFDFFKAVPVSTATASSFPVTTSQTQNLNNGGFLKTLFALLDLYENNNENTPPSKLPENTTLNNKQLKNAQIIANTTKQLCREKGLNSKQTKRAVEISLATAMQESSLINGSAVRNKDHDSVGLFQQRPSCGWGTVAQCEDPVYATRKFVSELINTDFMDKSLSRAAQSVQKSALPDAYAKHEGKAKRLAEQLC